MAYKTSFPQGRYLCGVAVASSSIPSAATAAPTDEVQASFHSSRNKQAKNNATYLLGADGQGVGELIDSLIFVNPENRYLIIYCFAILPVSP